MTTRDLAELLNHALPHERRSAERIAQRAGVSEATLYAWKRDESLGRVAAYLSILEFCGFELRLVRVKDRRKTADSA